MMSKEEVLIALKELFPDGIPDACGMVMAHKDAPFKSYQELRKILERSSAWGNRKNWKTLLDGVDDVEPPKKLTYNATISPNTLNKVGDKAVIKLTVLSGTINADSVSVSLKTGSDPVDTAKVDFGKYDPVSNTIDVTYSVLTNLTKQREFVITAKDLVSGDQKTPENGVLKVTLTEAPDLVADWTLSPSLLAKDSKATTKVTVTSGKLSGSRLTAVGANASLVKITATNASQGQYDVTVTGNKAGENAVVDLNMYVTDSKNSKEKLLGVKKLTITAGEDLE